MIVLSQEKLYSLLPPWLQNIAISLYGVRWRYERLGGQFDRYVEDFRLRDRWSPSEMNAWVEQQLRQRLLRTFDHVPYYRKTWTSAGLGRDELRRLTLAELPKLPLTPKEDFRQYRAAFTADDVPSAAIREYHTSGSTGTPLVAACTVEDHRRFIAAREARSFHWAGVSIRSPRSMIGGRMVVTRADATPPFYRYNRVERQVYFSAFHIRPSNLRDYLEGFEKYRPEVLTGYAQSHFLLARMMLAEGVTLSYQPKALILSSEKLTEPAREVIGRAFHARAFEEYGAVENCMLATECEQGGLHVHPDFGIVEVVDERGEPVKAGEVGQVVCTGLLNETQALVRYTVGDMAAWSETECPCGRRQLPLLKEVSGRIEDVVTGPDGREMVRFHGLFVNLPNVLAGQVIQERRDLLKIRVVVAPGFSAQERALIRRRVQERLGPVEVIVETGTDLERTPRGKIRAVIDRSNQRPEALRNQNAGAQS